MAARIPITERQRRISEGLKLAWKRRKENAMAKKAASRSERQTPQASRPALNPAELLKQITTSSRGRPNCVVIHGVEGVGKTSFATASPSPVFIMPKGETGLETLMDAGRVPATAHFPECGTWLELLACCESLVEGDHQHRTLVIDTLNSAERLCHEHVCLEHYGGNWSKKGFGNFQEGFETSLADWRRLLAVFDRLRSRGMGILCLAHSVVRTHRNADGADWDRWVPDLNWKTWALTNRYADVVLFANFADVPYEDGTRTKARGDDTNRTLHCVRSAAWDAKNRHGLPDEIDMGSSAGEAWANFGQAMKEAKAAK